MHPYISILGRTIPSFGVMLALGILAASTVAIFRAKKRNLSIDDLIIIITITMVMALLGANLLYILISYSFTEIRDLVSSGHFHFLMEGGLVFYGGLIAGPFGILLSYKIFSIKVLEYEQVLIPTIPLGHAIGRVGCFMAGCCHGKPYNGIGKVTYPAAFIEGIDPNINYFPSQILESFLNLGIFLILILYTRKNPKIFHSIFMYALLYSILRFFLEFFRGDEVRGVFMGFYTSQWISIFIVTCSILFFIFQHNKIQSNIKAD